MTNLDLIKLLLSIFYIIFGSVIFKKLFYAYRKFKILKKEYNYISDEDLPTVSVCIPVRNEGKVVEDSLNKILASDYPKMEIIVLDDDSVDNTSEIVKSFAHKGVRFIKGSELPNGWIGKNKALEKLSNEAMGEYILFLGIDTKISENSITDLIYYMVNEEISMISVMPNVKKFNIGSVFGTLRFFWEAILHSDNSPAVSTSAWMIKTEELNDYQDFFEKHKSTVRPEESLARYFYEDNKYRFLMANKQLKINYDKEWTSQINTSIRTLAPLFEKNVYLLGFIFSFLLSVIVGWILVVISFLMTKINLWDYCLIFGVLYISFNVAFYNFLTKPKNLIFGFLLTPYYFVQELLLLIISYVKYKYSNISWKDRRLPEVDD